MKSAQNRVDLECREGKQIFQSSRLEVEVDNKLRGPFMCTVVEYALYTDGGRQTFNGTAGLSVSLFVVTR